jgi:hypothetical protein
MRRASLHWSWAAGALAGIALVHRPLAGALGTLVVAALTATARGRRWHREDLEAGLDLADAARRRLRPLDAARLAIVSRRAGRGRLTVGEDERGRPVSIPFDGRHGGAHTLVVGATGSGKTVSQSWIAAHAIAAGMAAVVLDPKGDGALRGTLQAAARGAGRRFLEWTPTGPASYNPLAHGEATEIADRLLAGERFSEPHYLRQAQRYLGHAVRALRLAGREPSLAGVVRALDPSCLELLARELPAAPAGEIHAYLDSLSPRQRADLGGVRDRLAIVVESDVGRWLDPTAGGERLRLPAAVRERAVVYFDLRADSRPLLARMLGAAIVQDLLSTMAGLQRAPIPTLVAIDEFSAVAAERVAGLFGRGRSAGISLLLGAQELADLRPRGHEQLLDQILGNLTTLIAHRQAVPGSAELVSRLGGSRGAWRSTFGEDGRRTRRRASEPLLAPGAIAELPRGCAAVLVLGEARGARLAWMRAPHG